MTTDKKTATAEDNDGKLVQCSKCNIVYESGNTCPYCGEKQISYKSQPYESSGIREVREDQISNLIIGIFRERNLSAVAAIGVLNRTADQVAQLHEELDKAYRDSSPYKIKMDSLNNTSKHF